MGAHVTRGRPSCRGDPCEPGVGRRSSRALPYFAPCRGSRAGSCFVERRTRRPGERRRPGPRRRQRRQAVLAGRRAARPLHRRRVRRAAIRADAEARVSRPLFDADAADMPFADGAFDYAICSNLLEHVTDPEGVARELTRVAQSGLHRGPRGGERQDRRLPEPPVVVPARRGRRGGTDAGDDRQAGAVLRRGDQRLHRPGRRPTVARRGAQQQVRPPRHPAALDRHGPAAHRGGAGPGLRGRGHGRRGPPARLGDGGRPGAHRGC